MKKINKHKFKRFVADIPAMSKIVTKIGIDCLIVKVRTERKMGTISKRPCDCVYIQKFISVKACIIYK